MSSTEQPSLAFIVQNVVSTCNFGVQRLNLRQVCMDCPWCQINNDVFAALIGRIEDPKTTILAFTSSNAVCTGAKKVIDSRIACRMYISNLQDAGYEVSLRKFKVENIVASAYTGWPLQLEAIAAQFAPEASFDAEVFPGLIYRMKHPKIVFLIFREGKLVITGKKRGFSFSLGGKKISDIRKASDIFYRQVLVPYRDYADTLNYVHVQAQGNLASIVEDIVKEFGDEMDEPSGTVNDELDRLYETQHQQ